MFIISSNFYAFINSNINRITDHCVLEAFRLYKYDIIPSRTPKELEYFIFFFESTAINIPTPNE